MCCSLFGSSAHSSGQKRLTLRGNYQLKHNFAVFDEFDQHYFVYQRFSEFEALEGISHLAGNPATTSTWERSESLVKWINTVSEEALDIQTLLAAPDAAIQALGRCAQLYYTLLEEHNALDFSTIQREALHLLRNHPSVRDALKERIAFDMAKPKKPSESHPGALNVSPV